MDTITELDAKTRHLTKMWIRAPATGELKEIPYDRPTLFRVSEHAVADIFELGAALETIGSKSSCCVIRGTPLASIDREAARRQKLNFEDRPRSWSLHDFDSVACPEGLDWSANPEEAAAFVRSLLPPEFQGVSCWWQFTSSQGMKAGLRMRLAFWHSRAISGAELKLWITEKVPDPSKPRGQWLKVSPADPAVYGSVQPIYVAPPVFGAGVLDPVPRRSGILRGTGDTVLTPDFITPRFGAVAFSGNAGGALLSEATGQGYEHHRSRIGDDGDGFYRPMLAAVGAFFARHGSNADATGVIADLAAAARAARQDGAHRAAEVKRHIAELLSRVEWTRERQAHTEATQAAPGAMCPAPAVLTRVSLAEAERLLADAVSDAFGTIRQHIEITDTCAEDDAEAIPMPRTAIAISAGLGIGKTEAAIRETVRFIQDDPERRVAFAVPTHRVAEEVAARLNKAAGRPIAAVWRGITQPDPSNGFTMCRVASVVKTYREAGGSVTDVCGGPQRGFCPHHPNREGQVPGMACGYRQQFKPGVSVWVIPHAMLTSAPPRQFRRAFDLLVLDEAPWLSFFGGLDAPVTITLDELLKPHSLPGQDGLETFRYAAAVASLRKALEGATGPVLRDPFVEAGLSAGQAREIASLAWKLKGSFPFDRDRAADTGAAEALKDRLSGRPPFHLIRRFWSLLAEFLHSGEAVAPHTLDASVNSEGQIVLTMRWREMIDPKWIGHGVIYLDGTIVEEVARLWLSGLELRASVRAEETAVHRVQVFDTQLGKGSFAGKATDSEGEAKRLESRRQDARRALEVLAWRRGDVGFITYKDAAGEMKAGKIPAVMSSNFGAMRGVDAMRNVSTMVVAGRPMPTPRDVERMASIAGGRLVASCRGWYPHVDAALAMRDGTGRRVKSVQHPDALADAIRRQVLTEVEQAEGRARGVRRTALDPVLSVVLTAQPTELPIDEAVTLEAALDVNLVALLAARGVIPGAVSDAVNVLPDLFGGKDPASALRQQLSRAGEPEMLKRIVHGTGPTGVESVTNPYGANRPALASYLGEPPPAAFARYRTWSFRRFGGRQRGLAIVAGSPTVARRRLEELMGPIEVFRREQDAAWLEAVHVKAMKEAPEMRMEEKRPAAVEMIATNYRESVAVVPLPIGVDMLRMKRRGKDIVVHVFEKDREGRAAMLIRTEGAAWPPRAPVTTARATPPKTSPTETAAEAEPTFTADDVRQSAGVPRSVLRSWMMSPHVKRRIKEVGQERAIVEVLSVRLGVKRLGEAIDALVMKPGAPPESHCG